jgi:hypothetical protein
MFREELFLCPSAIFLLIMDPASRLTFPISPGGFGSIPLRLLTISAHLIPEEARMTIDGVPGLFSFLGSGGISVRWSQRGMVQSRLNGTGTYEFG